MTDHPDRPAFVLAVGVSGHRLNKLAAAEIARVERQIAALFVAIDAAAATAKAREQTLYAAGPPGIRLLTGMAEGADQMAVKLRPAGWQVDAVLPFPRARYREDFAPDKASGGVDRRGEFDAALALAGSVVELPDDSDAPDAYQAAGEFVLRQSDILVVVWDGEPAAGRGGTGGIVSLALDVGTPVVWVRSGGDAPPAFLGRDIIGHHLLTTPATDATIAEVVGRITTPEAPPAAATAEHGHGRRSAGPRERLVGFLAEPWRKRCRWIVFDSLLRFPRIGTWRAAIPLRSVADVRADWTKFAEAASTDADFSRRSVEVLARRYAWADALATYFAHVYRSAYVLTYLLAALAVAVALIDVLPFAPPESAVHASLSFKAVLSAIELAIVATIILLVRNGQRGRWHQRWLDYRMLAEMLRHLRFLGLVGWGSALLKAGGTASKAGSDWILWYLRATVREIGTAQGRIDDAWQRRVLQAVQRFEVDDQIAYNRRNRTNLDALDHRLHRIGNFCFFLTAVLLVAFLAAYFLLPGVSPFMPQVEGHAAETLSHLKSGLAFLDTLLPALGAAISGILFTGDFEGFAKRSGDTAAALENLKPDYAEAAAEPRFADTARVLVATAGVLAEDIGGWQSLYGRKKLALPA